MKPLIEEIGHRPLVSDGAMGTQLQQAGLPNGACGEAWNLEQPQKIIDIQSNYVEAGSDCLITNTFGGSRIMLERHVTNPDVQGINQAAVRNARLAFGANPGFVLGDIGPFGGLMEPYGEISPETVMDAFFEQAKALVDAGVDAILIETQTVLEEVETALTAARDAGAGTIIASMAFDLTQETKEFRTMMGNDPSESAERIQTAGADIIAMNCGTGIEMSGLIPIVQAYRRHCDLPIMVQPNAGQPELKNLQVIYHQTPQQMASPVPAVLDTGVSIIGGCCGSTPEHIRQIRSAVDQFIQAP